MQVFDSYIDAGQQLPQRDKERFYTALIEFIAYGTEPELDGAAAAVFTAIKPSLVISKKRAEAGRRGGNANAKNNGSSNFASKQNESNSQANDKANDKANEQLACEFAHTITNTITSTSTSKGVGGTGEGEPDPFAEADEAEAGFPWQCLSELNDSLGTSYATMPAKCSRTLARFADRFGPPDVRRMVDFKRDEWTGTQFERHLTPNTLFGPDHFEQYMQQSRKEVARNAQFDIYNR